jgi:hypothetical protein
MPKRDLDPDYLARVADLPCCVCELLGVEQKFSTEVHHKLVRGKGIRASDYETMPLCFAHHSAQTPLPFGHAVHKGTKSFEAQYGTQDDHIKETQRKLGYEPTT